MRSSAAEAMNTQPNNPNHGMKKVFQVPRPEPRQQRKLNLVPPPKPQRVELIEESDFEDDPSGVKSHRPEDLEAIENIEAEPVATRDEIYDLESTKVAIEATEVEGYTGSRVYVGMKNKAGGKPSEDFVIAHPDAGIVGVADGMGSTGKGAEINGLNPAARASRELSAIVSDEFVGIEQGMTPVDAERILKDTKILDIDPNLTAEPKQFQVKEHSASVETIEQILSGNPELAKKAAAMVKVLEMGQEGVKKTNGGMTTGCLVARQGDYSIVANVGDSMAFLQREGGSFMAVSREDTLLNFLLDRGEPYTSKIQELKADPEKTLRIGREDITYRGLALRSMGAFGGPDEQAKPMITFVKRQKGDRMIVVSDGIVDKYRRPDGTIDTERLTQYLGKREGMSPTDQIEMAINVAGAERTETKVVDDDKTIAIEDNES